jgi:tripartite-type tricarboxylate transporter receptor subunit TctC
MEIIMQIHSYQKLPFDLFNLSKIARHLGHFRLQYKHMKNLLLSIILSFFTVTAVAKETVTIVYSWGPSDTAANFHRTLVESANKIQNKYTFVFDTKPGAGGSIAANHVANTPNTILATASAFFIRPNFFPNESHDLNAFREIMPQCSAPAVITSSKYRNWKEVPTNRPLTIGVSGMGTTTHLIATQVAKKYPEMTVVAFKSTSDALLSVLSDSTDFAVNFLGDSEQYTKPGAPRQVYMLGLTGEKTVSGVAPLVSQGFPKTLALMDVPAQLLVPKTVSNAKFAEWRDILVQAGRAPGVQQAFAKDYCESLNQMPGSQLQSYYNTQVNTWQRLSNGVSLK